VQLRESRDGNFVSLTLMVRTENQAQLDAIYTSLSGNDQVLMVL
jgi:putative lipoic acid-binding regulatory protein